MTLAMKVLAVFSLAPVFTKVFKRVGVKIRQIKAVEFFNLVKPRSDQEIASRWEPIADGSIATTETNTGPSRFLLCV